MFAENHKHNRKSEGGMWEGFEKWLDLVPARFDDYVEESYSDAMQRTKKIRDMVLIHFI